MKIYSLIDGVRPSDDVLNLKFTEAGRKKQAGQILFYRRQKIAAGTFSKRQAANIHYRTGRQFRRTWQAAPRKQDKVSIAARYAARWAQKGFIELDIAQAAQLAEAAISPSQAAQIENLFNALLSIRNPDGIPSLTEISGEIAGRNFPPENMKASEKTRVV